MRACVSEHVCLQARVRKSRHSMLTLQLPLGGLTRPIFTHLCQILLGWGLYKASVLSKRVGREAPDLGGQEAQCQSSPFICFATHKALLRGAQ